MKKLLLFACSLFLMTSINAVELSDFTDASTTIDIDAGSFDNAGNVDLTNLDPTNLDPTNLDPTNLDPNGFNPEDIPDDIENQIPDDIEDQIPDIIPPHYYGMQMIDLYAPVTYIITDTNKDDIINEGDHFTKISVYQETTEEGTIDQDFIDWALQYDDGDGILETLDIIRAGRKETRDDVSATFVSLHEDNHNVDLDKKISKPHVDMLKETYYNEETGIETTIRSITQKRNGKIIKEKYDVTHKFTKDGVKFRYSRNNSYSNLGGMPTPQPRRSTYSSNLYIDGKLWTHNLLKKNYKSQIDPETNERMHSTYRAASYTKAKSFRKIRLAESYNSQGNPINKYNDWEVFIPAKIIPEIYYKAITLFRIYLDDAIDFIENNLQGMQK